MLKDIIAVEYVDAHRVYIRFEDGVNGILDISELILFTGVFAPLQDQGYFAKVTVNPELGTLCWPNGADFDPDVLYAALTSEPINVSVTVCVADRQGKYKPRS